VESSNMASLESGVGYFYLDTTGTSNVPGFKTVPQNCVPLVSEHIIECQACFKNCAILITKL